MKREICSSCQRAIQTCYCALISPVHNTVKVVVLQHPKEVGHSKGTLGLLAGSLTNCEVLIGECFDGNPSLEKLLTFYQEQICLLFPHQNSHELTLESLPRPHIISAQTSHRWQCMILLDATWKKAFKMYKQSTVLHNISHVHLPNHFQGQYQIRKTNKENALSTLEACCHALSLLENNSDKYQELLKSFVKFNQIQLSFRP